MALARWTATAQDAEGNAVAGCSIEVRSEETGRLVQVYADRDGTAALGNPFVAPEATFGFHLEGGAYKVTATKGSFHSIWRYVAIGTASEFDYDQLISELQAGLMPVATFAEIDGQAPGVDQSLAAIVLADPDPTRNGYYLWDQGAGQWQRKRPLPDTLARLTVVGGTGNALEALASPGVDPGAVLAFFIDVPTANIGPVTLSINGGPALPVRDVNGDDFAPGVFTGRLFLSNEGDHLRALIGGDIMAAVAASQAFATLSQRWAEGTGPGGLGTKSSREWAEEAKGHAEDASFLSWGLGAISAPSVSDLDGITHTRFFSFGSDATGRPPGALSGQGFHIAVGGPGQAGVQVAGPRTAPGRRVLFIRTRTAGNWSAWDLLSNRSPKITYITSSTTHTYDPLARAALIEGVGGGGGGGGTDAPSGQVQAASGGAAGSYFSKLLTDLPEEAVILIGGGGGGGPATASSVGGSGGTTSYTDSILGTISAPGGTRGQAHSAFSGNSVAIPQTGRVYPPESDIQGTSEPSTPGLIILGSARVTGYGGGGGSSPFGSGGQAGWVSTANGTAAGGSGEPGLGYGSGGGGSVSYGNEGKSTGAAGAPGLVKITEYF